MLVAQEGHTFLSDLEHNTLSVGCSGRNSGHTVSPSNEYYKATYGTVIKRGQQVRHEFNQQWLLMGTSLGQSLSLSALSANKLLGVLLLSPRSETVVRYSEIQTVSGPKDLEYVTMTTSRVSDQPYGLIQFTV